MTSIFFYTIGCNREYDGKHITFCSNPGYIAELDSAADLFSKLDQLQPDIFSVCFTKSPHRTNSTDTEVRTNAADHDGCRNTGNSNINLLVAISKPLTSDELKLRQQFITRDFRMVCIGLQSSHHDAVLKILLGEGCNGFGARTGMQWAFTHSRMDKGTTWILRCFYMDDFDHAISKTSQEYCFVESR